MKKTLSTMIVLAGLLTGSASTLSAQEVGARNVPPVEAFVPVQRYDITYDEPRDLAEFYIRDFGLSTYDADFAEWPHPSDRTMRVMLVTFDEVADDAVQAIQLRFGMRASKGSWETLEAGMRRKCRRGPDAGQWTRDVCP